MTVRPHVLVHADEPLVAAAAATRLIVRLADAIAVRGSAGLGLCGGGIGIATLRAVRESPARDAVDWRRVDFWWGDERFLPNGDPERNEVQAREALLDALDLDPERVHPMPSAPAGADAERLSIAAEDAANEYANELEKHAAAGQNVPRFDVLLSGMGAEGHTASIFPETPAAHDRRPVVAVHGSPKPPPTRLSLTFPTIQSAEEVWVLATGAAKAPAIGLALSGAGEVQIPVAGARGRSQTLWLLDRAAAAEVPAELRNPW